MLGELQSWFSGWPSVDRFRRDMDELLDRCSGEGGVRAAGCRLGLRSNLSSRMAIG